MSDVAEIFSDLPLPRYMVDGVHRALANLAAPGARWSGAERIEIAGIARAVKARQPRPEYTLVHDAARMAEAIATNAHSITQEDVDAFGEVCGRGPEAFVEMIGVVARTVAIDTFMTGIGSAVVALPEPSSAPATGEVNPRAKKRSAFVPVDGAAGATTALSAVPREDQAQEDLHGALYLSYREMGDFTIHKGLPRWQLEAIAARTSLINDCFY